MKLVSRKQLKNGFTLYSQHDPGAHLPCIFVKAGSLHDPANARGMAHYAEHIVFRRSDDITCRDLLLKLERYGCAPRKLIAVQTGHYSTEYGTDSLARRKYMHDVFNTFAGVLRDRIIERRGLEVEAAAILNEYYRHTVDDPEEFVSDLVHSAMYERNPARYPVIGDLEALKQATPEQVRRFVAQYYVPNNMGAVVLGPKFQEVCEMVEHSFGDWKAGDVPRLACDETRPVINGIKYVEVERKGWHLWHVAIAFPTEPAGEDDDAIDILADIWRFRAEEILREQNRKWGAGTYHPIVWTSRSSVHGLFYLWFETPSEEFARYGIDRLVGECERLKHGGILESEIQGAILKVPEEGRKQREKELRRRMRAQFTEEAEAERNALRSDYYDAFDYTPGHMAQLIIHAACNGDEHVENLNHFRERMNVIKPKTIIWAANEYLTTPQNYVCVVVKPVN